MDTPDSLLMKSQLVREHGYKWCSTLNCNEITNNPNSSKCFDCLNKGEK